MDRMKSSYQICSKCVMDTSDSEIVFDDLGVCNHCHSFENVVSKSWFPNEEGSRLLEEQLVAVREKGKANEYDCILGLSGGVDSSYLALKIADLGLRPLVVHVDAGWNSETAVNNIEKIVTHCGFELYTHVMDWEEMKDLQLAYLRAGVSNQDVPQDHAFFANLYHFAVQNNITTVLSGGNIATEGVFPESWHGSAMDAINLKAIHHKFGSSPLKHYRTISFWQSYFWFPFIKKMTVIRPLNFMPYSREEAIQELETSCDWRSYGRKHGESLFTRFFQNHYLPKKFGYDKRRAHYSSMIVSGQLERDEALKLMEEPLYDGHSLEVDKSYFCKKLDISIDELDRLMDEPNRHYSEFANWDGRYKAMKRIQNSIESLLGRRISSYS